MRLKQYLFPFLVGFGLLLIPLGVHAEVIDNFYVHTTIQKDGYVWIKEQITYDFESAQKHGIIRKIPIVKKNSDGKMFKMGISIMKVADENGAVYSYTTSTVGDTIQIKVGDANTLISGKHVYVIDYLVDGALTYFSDHDELYWNVTGNEWTVTIMETESTIILPSEISVQDIKGACFTGSEGSKEQNCFVTNGNPLTIRSASYIPPSTGLTQVIGFPKGIVAVREPKEYTRFEDTLLGKLIGLGILLGIFIWYIGLPVYIPLKWYFAGRDPKADSVRVWYDPPKDKANRVLTPAETGSLVDESVDSQDMFGSLIQLAQRGYLQIVEKKKNDFSFVKKNDWNGVSEILPFENMLLNGIFKSKDEVRVKDVELSSEMNTVSDSLYKQIVTSGFFQGNPKDIRTKYYALAVFAMVTGNIFLAIIAFIFGKNMPRKTLFGAQQASIGRSLQTFLSSQERQLEFQAKNQLMFEKLLPYAIVFGVERVWANRFKDITMTPPDWYTGYSNNAFNAALLSSSLHNSMNTFKSSMTPTRSSSGFSSGFSGGGFSGGGGGGGGGGSW